MTPQQVLIEHQRTGDGGCLCEADRRDPTLLGYSHAQHVLDELAKAGFRIVRARLPVRTW